MVVKVEGPRPLVFPVAVDLRCSVTLALHTADASGETVLCRMTYDSGVSSPHPQRMTFVHSAFDSAPSIQFSRNRGNAGKTKQSD